VSELLKIDQSDIRTPGKEPMRVRELPQVFEAPPNLAINLKTAELIGFSINLPIEVPAAADEFYREIIRPE